MSEATKQHHNTFAIVGELVMIFNSLDWQINHVVIEVFNLGEAKLLEPVVANLDMSRKIHMLKERASVMHDNEWRKQVVSYCKKLEEVTKQRNIACHSAPVLENNVWKFKSVQATKLFKAINFETKELRGSEIEQFASAIRKAEEALGQGDDLIRNFQRANAILGKGNMPVTPD